MDPVLQEANIRWFIIDTHELLPALAQKFPQPAPLIRRARAQASDWPFILRSGTHADYARQRVETHLLCFTALYKQLNSGRSTSPPSRKWKLRTTSFQR